MTRIRAEEDILIPKPGLPGAFTIAYHKGDFIREEDMEALGLGAAAPQAAPTQDKAERGPREPKKRTRASRDKALSKPKEE
jgi:hypothetical protein